jgi:uncharacterized membrane protein
MAALHSPPQASTAYPFSALFVPLPFVCFTLTFVTDILYWRTSNLMWSNFSDWLLFFGLIFGALALIAGLIDFVRPATRALRPSLASVITFLAVLVLALFNSLIHAGDGWTAIVPAGLITSAVTLLVMIASVYFTAATRTANAWRIP